MESRSNHPRLSATHDRRQRSFVRVLGVRRGTFVEFSFALDDPELAVELVLPYRAFVELCSRYDTQTIAPEPEVANAYAALARTRSSS